MVFKKFRADDESPENDERSGRPSDVDNDQLRALVEANTCITVRELASELDVTYTTISNHLREISIFLVIFYFFADYFLSFYIFHHIPNSPSLTFK